jgi:hypothetical protein
MSVVTAIRPNPTLYVTTTEAHVRAAHESYSKHNPELCGRLHDDEEPIWFRLFVPALGETLTYRTRGVA